MKYILMINGNKANWDAYAKWSKEDQQRNVAFMRAFSKELKDSGVFVATEALGGPTKPRLSERERTGSRLRTGVFADSKEFLAGYWIIDVESPEQAYKIAARASAAPGPGGTQGACPLRCGKCSVVLLI